ncbi:hypothetical protein BST17_08450 [Mycolicibacterium bacteremicum]|uniref:Uncharacterized protein n=1 Tax=Mycolicibacterium bacteremicum TaxID=564198 RepID=A0A1W9Z0E5_MYCBA|nr:hypothetical protein BST17_08450 [Mycolicibacterium bacteremicum]
MPNPEPGELYLTPRGQWAQAAPSTCGRGHWLGPGRVLVGTVPCDCGVRHSTWWCREPDCGDTVYGPPLTAGCRIRTGPDER